MPHPGNLMGAKADVGFAFLIAVWQGDWKNVRNAPMHESTITSKGQTTLPRDIRDALGLQSGDRVRYILVPGGVSIHKVHSVMELRGMLAQPDQKPVSLESMEEAIAEGAMESGNLP